VAGVEIENVGTTAKTLPDFPDMWTGMLGEPSGAVGVSPGALGVSADRREV